MKDLLVCIAIVLIAAGSSAQADLTLPDGTITANRQDSGTGASSWWGEVLTTLTIDAQSVPSGYRVDVSGKITGISNTATSWVEIGLIPKATWDYWQTAYGGSYRSAVFDKGIYVVDWSSAGLGLTLQEGWASGGSTVHNKGPYAWPLGSPWQFEFRMDPSGGGGGGAYLDVAGATEYGAQPWTYTRDYSQCYLIAQIWSTTQNASFSFEDVKAAVVPAPAAVLLGLLGLSVAGVRLRKRA